MKIGDSSRPFVDQLGIRDDKPSGVIRPQFQELFATSSAKLQKNEMDALLKSIDDVGKQLLTQCSWTTLMSYKDKIKQFLQAAIKGGFAAQDRFGRDRRGRTKLYKIVSQIDDLMVEITELVLAEEKDHLSLLGKIGDLRGLLLNLYW